MDEALIPLGDLQVSPEVHSEVPLAAADPVALVALDLPLPHLDRGFEYAVPAELAEQAQPGCRVKVIFSHREANGYLLERRPHPEYDGRLAPLRRVVSPEPVLTSRLAQLARRIADEQAGTFADVARLAVPPRHARAEKQLRGPGEISDLPEAPDRSAWSVYPAGESLLRRLADGEEASAAWTAATHHDPVYDWPAALAEAARATFSGGRGAVIVLPDGRDVDRVDQELTRLLGTGRHVVLTAALGPEARYRAWLKVLRGYVRVVVGTKAAAFAPVADLGLVAWWDDGDNNHVEKRSPYPHVRQILLAQAELSGASILAGGVTRTAAVQALVDGGRVKDVLVSRAERRAAAPKVYIAGEGVDEERDGPAARAHLPGIAWRVARSALETGPVLVQVPRRGYIPALSCERCRTPARCPECSGPLSWQEGATVAGCRWCGRNAADFCCPACGGFRLRIRVMGAQRTMEELGRAFPGVPVVYSRAGSLVECVEAKPAMVVATPGAEPRAELGYAAVLLLDAWASLDRPVLDAGEEALRRWTGAACLTGPGGRVVLAGVPEAPSIPAVEALVRWAPEWFAGRELVERAELCLPPTAWVASLRGTRRAVTDLVDVARLPPEVERLGPLPVPESEDVHLLLRAPHAFGAQAAGGLHAARAVRGARGEPDLVSVRVGVVDF
ncbi:primosomal protein N' [Austwickia chelonae]|uniref:primosomal protein N' n=1 Tax=Austwickia chelonae TaxID=100225 RepID=UPI0013C2E981|nr:primosomal protein N' [Austwickia chelonae]